MNFLEPTPVYAGTLAPDFGDFASNTLSYSSPLFNDLSPVTFQLSSLVIALVAIGAILLAVIRHK